VRRAPSRVSIVLVLAALGFALTSVQCARDTSRLSSEQEARFQGEGILRRADNIVFHYTREFGYRREERRENRLASIVVTSRTVLIHKNEKVGIEITPESRRAYDVHRRGSRVRLNAGSGKSVEVWSFEPPSDAAGWTRDIRAVIRNRSEGGRSGSSSAEGTVR
jgi:hypothetical protein